MRIVFLLLAVLYPAIVIPQSMPEPYPLGDRAFILDEWSSGEQAGNYPDGMIFHTTDEPDPPIGTKMTGDWIMAYNLSSGSRISGKDSLGISFFNTGLGQDGSYVGAAIIALDVKELTHISISWKGRTFKKEGRLYAITLQYKESLAQSYTTIATASYETNEAGHEQVFNTLLPLQGNDVVYLRWVYHYISGDQGARSELGIDDIKIDVPTGYCIPRDIASELKISPNPAWDRIYVDLPEIDDIKSVSIIDYSGKNYSINKNNIVYLGQHKLLINVNNYVFSRGTYIIHLQGSKAAYSGKINLTP
ncbi:MAG: T9SS type A sorting domain-containing protein [Candidatus Kapaibacterium sp.]